MIPEDIEKYQDEFSENAFWAKVKKAAKKAGLGAVYVAMILYYELRDPQVSSKEKAILLGALGYFILPIDLVPDFVPMAGYVDDFAALVAAYSYVKGHLSDNVKKQAQDKLREWFGDVDFTRIDPDAEQLEQ